ncbi:uncharacterized protein LOC111346869, partial [Stylophora pistillata]|uniref:uncharacterized protein LOC111346869 n=1 Tax=Stylophora pistillata TaxID=50429 RepID=UPI000C04262F
MEPLATDSRPATFQIEFEIVEDSTKRGRNKLVDSRGYTYNVKRRRGGHIDWQCTVRPKGNVCRATVVERASGELVLGPTPHNHPGKVGASLAARIIAKTKKEAVANLFKPASEVVNEVLMEELTEDPCPSLPRPINLAKAANHLRQRLRPTDPVDLEFESQPEHIPQNFLRGDIRVRGRRHLLFASQQQLEVLCRAKAWYIDGTFKLCRNPFSQPLNINAFVRSDSFAKQVSLLFAIIYLEHNWIVNNIWPPSCWSVCLSAIRTNNDVEGWHNGLNRRAQGKSQLPLYMLIQLLHEESRL